MNALAAVRRKRQMPFNVERIGVICSPALGDTLLFSSVLQDLRTHFHRDAGGAEIIHFCMRSNLAAAEMLPGADRLMLVDLTNPLKTIRLMRAQSLDVLFDFTSWQRLTAFYGMFCGARFTAGFRTAGQYRGRGYDLSVEHRDDRHEIDNFRAVLGALGIPAGAPPAVMIPQIEADAKRQEPEDLVVFHLWASGQRNWLREWPEDRWITLACSLARAQTVFAITGSPSDSPRVQAFVRKLQTAGLEAKAAIGTDGFMALARMLTQARVVVSVNTGVMHLAAIVGAPTVSINGPNRNGRWGPVGARAIGVEAPGADCGYLHLGFDFDGQATDCMERISVEQVLETVAVVEAL